jgi:hypothetical protein
LGKFGKELYSKLAALAKQYLAVTGASVPSERLFYVSGRTLTERRRRLRGERFSRLIFLSSAGEG